MESRQNQNIEDRQNSIKDLFEEAEEYGKTSIELLKMKAVDFSSDLLSLWVSHLIVVITILICVVMLSIGAALWAGNQLGKSCYGFFVVAVFYAFVALILYFFLGKHLKKYVGNFIIKQLLK